MSIVHLEEEEANMMTQANKMEFLKNGDGIECKLGTWNERELTGKETSEGKEKHIYFGAILGATMESGK